MRIRFGDILQKVLFYGEGRKRLLAVVSVNPEHEQGTRPKEFYEPLVEGCDPVYYLPDDEGFVESLERLLDEQKPDDVFVLPPFRPRNRLSNEFRQEHPRLGLEEVVLQVLANKLPAGSRIAAFLPAGFFFNESSRGFRETLLTKNTLKFVFTPDFDPNLLGLPFTAMIRIGCAVIHLGSDDPSLRFFRITSPDPDKTSPIDDFENLIRRRSGHTQYGYVIKEGLAPGMPVLYDLYSPAYRSKLEKLGQLGGTANLSDLVDLVRGLNATLESKSLVKADSEAGVRLLNGMALGSDGRFLWDNVRNRVIDPPDRFLLKVGDVCLPAVQSARPHLKAVVVHEDDLPAAASDKIIVLRPKQSTSAEQLQVLHAYLRTPQAVEDLAAQARDLHLTGSALSSLKIPIPDEALGIAIRSLDQAIQQFRSWADEAARAKDSLFTFSSISESRAEILSLGRMTRRRAEAAHLASDLRHRLRTQFPHPVAFRWRTVESSFPDLEGYQNVLECAENLAGYVAGLVILHSRLVEGGEIQALRQLGERLAQNARHGVNMGDWVNIIREAAQSKVLQAASATPFFEAADSFRGDSEANKAIQSLSSMRNDHAHGRGPKGEAVRTKFDEASSTLEQLLQSLEFLADYPLRYVEWTRRDSMRKTTRFGFRSMMGDHPLAHLEEAEGDFPDLETGSLYLMDRNSKPHLARPFLVMRICPVCNTRSTFMIEKHNASKSVCTIKSLEHGHSVEDAEIVVAYKYVGFL